VQPDLVLAEYQRRKQVRAKYYIAVCTVTMVVFVEMPSGTLGRESWTMRFNLIGSGLGSEKAGQTVTVTL